MGVQLLVTALEDEETARLLSAHGVLLEMGTSGEELCPGVYRRFASLDEGMVFCETEYLKVLPFPP